VGAAAAARRRAGGAPADASNQVTVGGRPLRAS